MAQRGAEPSILIAGAGPVGSACALLLARGGLARERIALVDARPKAGTGDTRAIALNHGSRVLLESVGAWPVGAAPITTIHVSQRGRFGRTMIESRDHGVPALGYVVGYDRLMHALEQALDAAGIAVERGVAARVSATRAQGVMVAVGERTRAVDVFVAAEGAPSDTAGTDVRRVDYMQSALVATVRASHAPAGWAYERFTDAGPVALLPSSTPAGGGGSLHCLVWCGRPLDGARRGAMTPEAFDAELQTVFGDRAGRLTLAGPRALFPLALNAHPTPANGCVVRIGNAAQTLHPVAGQGLNLGLRDAACLAQALLAGHDTPPAALRRFAAARTPDRQLTTRLTDWMARAFATPFSPLQHGLGLTLAWLDVSPMARAILSRQMMVGQR